MELLSKEEYQKIAQGIQYPTKAFIDGEKVESVSGKIFSTENPATGEKLTEITACNEEDVDLAVRAARRAFNDKSWSGLAPVQRKKVLQTLSELILEHKDELAVLESLDSGRPISDIAPSDVYETAECFAWHGEAADKLEDQVTASPPDIVSMIVREPIGVVGAVLPWNFPMLMAAWKLGPILAAGNSVVVKPSKLTTMTMLRIAELAQEAGIPAGVLNVVTGSGALVGEAIALHPDVNLITFTGSTAVGRTLLEYSGKSNLKRVLLELGGKNPCIVMPNITDLEAAAEEIAQAAFWNMGENCSANSRLIVHKDIKDELLKAVIEKTKAWTVGDPLDPQFRLGSMIEKSHMEKVLEYIETSKAEGADLVYGGRQILQETGGYFIEPTIFDNVTAGMTIAKEEVFGPVLAVMTFSNEEEAIEMANDTEYGLHASIWSKDVNEVHRLSRGIQAGTISVNCFSEGDMGTPFGGFKQSGFIGRDKSLWASRQYTEMKTIWMKIC
ncbi:aldehyde dehydrogenase [Desulfosporosinus meridiei]|uniref:NAD-dependent aldehyde dehydrogenase n=1 Tax=Desulfosporosinus meridiei (strain ATCC BAA-275 / DSM 13257 / KCTC 12902 / NCIMB 13706 / S10) TaxID=768704 RepID=J7J1N0_DESMD|nr:aldehyde dehydrogenase [Desulfosporosinus meridiei]AFQ45223.1 NAD-dependent aldehyde dehydrogenase [Desulfosporosinus meridiei DSM 13257]